MENSRLNRQPEQLLPRIVQGDIAAFDQLFREMYPALHFLASKLVANGDRAKDIVSDVFLHLWESRHSLDHVKDIRGYLYITTRNRTLNYLKRMKTIEEREFSMALQGWKEPSADDFLEAIFTAETLRALREAIQDLPAECKKVVELGLEGLTTNEIADKLDISPSAVSHQKARAIRLLKGNIPLATWLILLVLLERPAC